MTLSSLKTYFLKPQVAHAILGVTFFLFMFEFYFILQVMKSPIPEVTFSPKVQSFFKNPKKINISAQYFGVISPYQAGIKGVGMPSTIRAEVVGILYAKPKKDSQVVLKMGMQDEKVYCIGDEIQPGVILIQINKDNIVFNHNGHIETLGLPKERLIIEPPPKPLTEEN
jgi:type II secretory pathway component PulC